MKKRTGILGVLIAILIIGIGYAAISNVNLIINGTGTVTADPNNFKVVYTAVGTVTKPADATVATDTIDANGVTTTSFTVTGLTKKGEIVEIPYTITNKSEDLGATLGTPSISISGTNASEYFTVTSSTAANSLAKNGGTTTQTVHVEVAKTPIGDPITGTFTITVAATPVNE